jgi:hypothetical protein
MKSEAHAKPITLVLQPTILHSIFFFISFKIQQQTKGLKVFFHSILCSNPIWCNFVTLFSLVEKERYFQLQLKPRKKENILKKLIIKQRCFQIDKLQYHNILAVLKKIYIISKNIKIMQVNANN